MPKVSHTRARMRPSNRISICRRHSKRRSARSLRTKTRTSRIPVRRRSGTHDMCTNSVATTAQHLGPQLPHPPCIAAPRRPRNNEMQVTIPREPNTIATAGTVSHIALARSPAWSRLRQPTDAKCRRHESAVLAARARGGPRAIPPARPGTRPRRSGDLLCLRLHSRRSRCEYAVFVVDSGALVYEGVYSGDHLGYMVR